MKRALIALILVFSLSLNSCGYVEYFLGGISEVEIGMTESEVSSCLGFSISYDKKVEEGVRDGVRYKVLRYKGSDEYYYFEFEDGYLVSWWSEDR